MEDMLCGYLQRKGVNKYPLLDNSNKLPFVVSEHLLALAFLNIQQFYTNAKGTTRRSMISCVKAMYPQIIITKRYMSYLLLGA